MEPQPEERDKEEPGFLIVDAHLESVASVSASVSCEQLPSESTSLWAKAYRNLNQVAEF
jgi:hypothetical protein